MAWPSPRRIALASCFTVWVLIQIGMVLPKFNAKAVLLSAKLGDFMVCPQPNNTLMLGAFSKRWDGFVERELVPYLRKQGVNHITHLVLTGHGRHQTGGIQSLANYFPIQNIYYPTGSARAMRQTFQQITSRQTRWHRLEAGSVIQNSTVKMERFHAEGNRFILHIRSPDQSWIYEEDRASELPLTAPN